MKFADTLQTYKVTGHMLKELAERKSERKAGREETGKGVLKGKKETFVTC